MSGLHILQQSPHDRASTPSPCATGTAGAEPGAQRWVPSRYTLRATTDDGRLVLWHSLRSTMSVFKAEQKALVEMLLSRTGVESREKGAVKYLKDRGFLVREGTDEYRIFQMAFGRQHYRTDVLQLILLASEDCNFRCKYCYEEFSRGTMQPEVRQAVKTLVQRRLPDLRSLAINWFGGEPLYGLPAIEELAPFFLRTAEENDLSYQSIMSTNGYLLIPEVAEKLLAWRIRRFQITLDGPPESHDCSRPTRTGEGSFQQIFENLKALSRRDDDFLVNLRVNFDRLNYPKMDDFFDLVEDAFSNDSRFMLRFRQVGKWGGANDEQLPVCGVEEGAEAQERMRQEARRRGLALADNIRQVGLGAHACYASRPYNFIIGATGKVMKCTVDLDMKDRNVVGQLDAAGNLNLDDDKFALWTEPAFEKDTKCQKCVVLPTCQGIHCPQVRFDENRSPCTPLRRDFKRELRDAVAASTTERTIKVKLARSEADPKESAAGA